ncbi:hypothetical protein FDF15_06025 [Clostridium botulinum]|uniref:hypothetical protein n=1 Tax=Clostridium botulinum TaxID=1491 RepID=UPI000774B44F|nr:hypothetical protein [Clostridium botulinum]APH22577.1 hypothetical protein NPD1_3559 [Clostridium botulinum]APQ70144.1 hypothetical protein RSJ8_1685 [Clostridium botulinum]MBN3377406.1 hypothetical protein [Clostridium botulinum]MBN3404506.1 hypothetical protein [Clostridium botulinum]MBY6996878.1 hypothetical protein [Clostridium botulinum]
MYSVRKQVYADDLIEITEQFIKSICEIRENLIENTFINEGLFVMANSKFEDSLRQIMRIVLCSFPEKLHSKTCKISRKDVIKIADTGYEVIIDNELYLLFKDGVQEQIEKLFLIINNLEYKNMDEGLIDCIRKCADISLYRNALIHNGGKATNNLYENAKIFKVERHILKISYNKELINQFLDVYLELFNRIEREIKDTYMFYSQLSKIDKIKIAWEKCFKSPILKFEDYWYIDNENDLIKGVKHSQFEHCISSSEEIFLSIWRHQYDDSIPTKEFLLCSINHKKISQLYEDLVEVEFYYMKQIADEFLGKI